MSWQKGQRVQVVVAMPGGQLSAATTAVVVERRRPFGEPHVETFQAGVEQNARAVLEAHDVGRAQRRDAEGPVIALRVADTAYVLRAQ